MINGKVWHTFSRQVYVSTAISQSLSGTIQISSITRLYQWKCINLGCHVNYSLHSSTRQSIQSHCFSSPVSRPSRNYCFNTSQNETSINLNPWVFCYPSNTDSSNCCPFLGQHALLIAAHSWDNILCEFPGRWQVLLARVDYIMHYLYLARQACKTRGSGGIRCSKIASEAISRQKQSRIVAS